MSFGWPNLRQFAAKASGFLSALFSKGETDSLKKESRCHSKGCEETLGDPDQLVCSEKCANNLWIDIQASIAEKSGDKISVPILSPF